MAKSTKTLFIVRHAKSSWDYMNVADLDRPLKHRGIGDAYEMARRLKINLYLPQFYISSPANRALHTSNIFMRVLEADFKNFRLNDDLYGRGPSKVFEVVRNCQDEISSLMIFGHNPDFSELASEFSKERYIELPSCGIAKFEFDSNSWRGISANNQVSEFTDYPKKNSLI